jgi:hypothetical protein
LDIWVNYWFNINLCTKVTDEEKAERHFYNLYKQLNLKNPNGIVWCNSPFDMHHQMQDRVNYYIYDNIWSRVFTWMWNNIENPVRDQVWGVVFNQVTDKVWCKVWSVVNKEYLSTLVQNVSKGRFGQHEAGLLAHYAYYMQVLRTEIVKPLVLYMLLAQEVNWYYLTEEFVYVIRKPKECIVKNNKLVKLVYQDGYTIT